MLEQGVPWGTCDAKRTECQTRLHNKLDGLASDIGSIKIDMATIKSSINGVNSSSKWWKDVLKGVVTPIIVIVVIGLIALLVKNGYWK